ncbi:hypothetical protein L596_000786 [Steinernema carpocapsae]|uniref:Uncharacterized protein n=1 Tax=Steinernema carpocapsae TaxID=34508 RepID=A0A4U8UJ88_STECR|nr:hypothetical protein L596_000786 [Steinernema carpocapsae]
MPGSVAQLWKTAIIEPIFKKGDPASPYLQTHFPYEFSFQTCREICPEGINRTLRKVQSFKTGSFPEDQPLQLCYSLSIKPLKLWSRENSLMSLLWISLRLLLITTCFCKN